MARHDGTREVQVHHRLQVCDRHFARHTWAGDECATGVADDDVNPPECCFDLRDHRPYLCLVGRVGDDPERPAIKRAHLIDHGLASRRQCLAVALVRVQVNVRDDNIRAEASEAEHSAMRAFYLTPGVSVRVVHGLSLYGLFQARVWGHTGDANVVGKSHVLVGTTYTLSR